MFNNPCYFQGISRSQARHSFIKIHALFLCCNLWLANAQIIINRTALTYHDADGNILPIARFNLNLTAFERPLNGTFEWDLDDAIISH